MKRFFAVLLSVSMFGIWSCTHDRSFDEAGAQGQPFDKCPVGSTCNKQPPKQQPSILQKVPPYAYSSTDVRQRLPIRAETVM